MNCATVCLTVLDLSDDKWVKVGAWKQGGGEYIEGYVLRKQLKVVTSARCLEIRRDAVVYEKDGERVTLPCDCVYYAVGMRSEDSLYEELAALGLRLSIAGDCKKPGKVSGAVHSGFFAAMDIGKF